MSSLHWALRRAQLSPTEDLPMPSKNNQSIDLMFKGLAKAKLLTPEEVVEISNACREAKLEVWRSLLSDTANAEMILATAVHRMTKKSVKELDRSSFSEFLGSARSLERSKTSYRVTRFSKSCDKVVAAVSGADVCLRVGGSLIRDMNSGAIPSSSEIVERAYINWKRFVRLRNEFIEKNMRLVIKVAKPYRVFNIPYEDLIQEGTFGLQRAIDLFDPSRGFRFSTYACWWIRAAITRYCKDRARVVRIPVHMQEAYDKFVEIKDGDDTLDDDAIAERMGISTRKLRTLQSMQRVDYFSIDAKLGPSDESTLGNILPAHTNEFQIANINLDMKIVSEVLRDLPPRERHIIECRFGLAGKEERTLQEIANEYDLSRERIRQIQNRAMNSIRSRIERRQIGIQAGLR